MASSGNFCVWNAVMAASNFTGTLSIGNTKSQPTSDCVGFGTMAMTTGKKWYFEARAGAMSGGSSMIGIMKLSDTHSISNYNTYQHSNTNLANAYYVASGDRILNGSGSTVGGAYSENDVIGVAVDLESSTNTITFYKNNSGQGSLNLTGTGIDYVPSLIRVPNAGGFIGNWGQDSTFGGAVTAGGNTDANGFGDFLYSVPSQHLAICSANLGISDDIDPAQTDDDYPSKQFNAVTYTGNGSTQSISVGFKPDMVWYKRRDTTNPAVIMDSSRGVSESLEPSLTGSADTNFTQGITSFDTDGFSLGSQVQGNGSGGNLIAWCWRANGGTTASNSDGATTATVQANTKSGFSIVEIPNYSGTTTLGHGLSKAPEFIIVKLRASSSQWIVQHTGLAATQIIKLNSSNSASTDDAFNDTAPTSSVFSLGSGFAGSGTAIAYCWHSVEGYSKFGSYEGNGSTDGTFIYTGFRPRMVFVKQIDGAAEWAVYDTARDTSNEMGNCLEWDLSAAEKTHASNLTTDAMMVFSNGFKLTGGGGGRTNQSDRTFIYGAWGDVPAKYPNTF